MPTLWTTLTEILLYVAPGMVVVYAMSPVSAPLRNLIADAHTRWPSFALLFVWMVVGGVIARGCGMLLIKTIRFFAKGQLNGDQEERLEIYKAVFRQSAAKIRYYSTIQYSMETFAATAVALFFFGAVRLITCLGAGGQNEILLAVLLLILALPLFYASRIAVGVFFLRGKAFQEIVKEQQQEQSKQHSPTP
jgi:hypothetical protein